MQTPKNRPNQSFSFWDQLEQDIDRIGNRAKEKLTKYQLSQYTTPRNNANPESSKPSVRININRGHSKSYRETNSYSKTITNVDRRGLEKLEKVESQKESKMRNRLMYIQQDREKQNKTIELAKRKYEHIVSVRTQNFKQKEVIRKKIMSIQAEDKHMKSAMVQEVKTAKQRRNMSVENWKFLASENASQIRNQTMNNLSFTAAERARTRQQNLKKANDTKKSLQRSRSIVSQARSKKIQSTKSSQKQKLNNRLQALTQHKKHNEAIFTKLRLQTQKISKWKSRAQKEIEQYRSYLGVGAGKKNQTMYGKGFQKERDSEKSLKSFYITHF